MMARASASESDDGTVMGGGAFWPSAGCAMQSDRATSTKAFMVDLPRKRSAYSSEAGGMTQAVRSGLAIG